jgi:hypothetical protein
MIIADAPLDFEHALLRVFEISHFPELATQQNVCFLCSDGAVVVHKPLESSYVQIAASAGWSIGDLPIRLSDELGGPKRSAIITTERIALRLRTITTKLFNKRN